MWPMGLLFFNHSNHEIMWILIDFTVFLILLIFHAGFILLDSTHTRSERKRERVRERERLF